MRVTNQLRLSTDRFVKGLLTPKSKEDLLAWHAIDSTRVNYILLEIINEQYQSAIITRNDHEPEWEGSSDRSRTHYAILCVQMGQVTHRPLKTSAPKQITCEPYNLVPRRDDHSLVVRVTSHSSVDSVKRVEGPLQSVVRWFPYHRQMYSQQWSLLL